MKVGIYARVAAQTAGDAIGWQLEALRAAVAAEGQEVVAEFVDNGYSGLRLDRPGMAAMRDAAEAGNFEAVWCLSPDRLSRDYTILLDLLDELTRHQVSVRFLNGPAFDPLAGLLAQMWAMRDGAHTRSPRLRSQRPDSQRLGPQGNDN